MIKIILESIYYVCEDIRNYISSLLPSIIWIMFMEYDLNTFDYIIITTNLIYSSSNFLFKRYKIERWFNK